MLVFNLLIAVLVALALVAVIGHVRLWLYRRGK